MVIFYRRIESGLDMKRESITNRHIKNCDDFLCIEFNFFCGILTFFQQSSDYKKNIFDQDLTYGEYKENFINLFLLQKCFAQGEF